jgi:putative SOS response-associated peptidase YedK
MTSHYESLQQADSYRDAFKVEPPAVLGERHLWPRKPGFCIRSVEVPADTSADTAAVVPRVRELLPAQWGLVPHWVKSASDGKLRAPKLVVARSETASTSQNFRDAWLNGQRCIVPVQAFYEDDWRSGKAVATRISRVDGQPMAVAGLWACWTSPEGEPLFSYAMLTVNANSHALMRRYQPAGNDKHMPVILGDGVLDAWLNARVEKAKEFMRPYPAQSLAANPVETKADKVPKGLF